jgi:hypothetical protein
MVGGASSGQPLEQWNSETLTGSPPPSSNAIMNVEMIAFVVGRRMGGVV